MIIGSFNFNIYITFIILGLVLAFIYSSVYMVKENATKFIVFIYVVVMLYFIICGGVLLSFLEQVMNGSKEIQLGLSSYGGCIGLIIGLIVLDKMTNNHFKSRYIISLPLIYSISKLGCFFAGCCYGIPYDRFMSVTYVNGLNTPLFPVQLVETIVFFVIFAILHFLYNKTKYIIEYTLISCSLAKFLLDYLRYSHLNVTISMNQIISILFFVIGTGIIIYKGKRKNDIIK